MNVIIFGTNETASLTKFYLTNDSEYDVVGFTADESYCQSSKIEGLPLVPFTFVQEEFSTETHGMICPVSDNFFRSSCAYAAEDKGYKLISYVSSNAIVLSSVGKNCFILEGNVIQPHVEISNNVIMWSGNHVGHHSVIEENVFITSHVVISGRCIIKKYCFLGVNSALRDGITLEEYTFVEMGSNVTRNTEKHEKWTRYM